MNNDLKNDFNKINDDFIKLNIENNDKIEQKLNESNEKMSEKIEAINS